MPNAIIEYEEIKAAIGLPKARLSTVERELKRLGLPYLNGRSCVFAMRDAWLNKSLGVITNDQKPEKIELL